MKKFIIAVLVIAIAVVAVSSLDNELHESNVRAVRRSIAVERLAGGTAPMQQECERTNGMVFRVDETGVTRCSGVDSNAGDTLRIMMQNEVLAMAEMDRACALDGGVLIVEKTIWSDNTTVLACKDSRFQLYWTSK